jgi:Holliday junction resolvasome RuvABC endonuclease subunit
VIPRVVGIDSSLTSAGLCRVDAVDGWTDVRTTTVGSKGHLGSSLAENLTRVRGNVRRILDFSLDGLDRSGPLPIFAIEGPAFASSTAFAHLMAGQWWLLVHLLAKEGIVVEIPPSSLKLYATGKGNAKKDVVLAAAVKTYPDIEVTGNDIADGVTLAAMVRRQLGAPIEPSRARITASALDRVRWPMQIAERN